MSDRRTARRLLGAAAALVLLATGGAEAAEVKVMISGGLSAAYKALVPAYEAASGNKVTTAFGPSMGNTPEAIPARLARGEPVDVLIMVGYALDGLIKEGKVTAASKVELVRSPIGVAVKAGAPKPDIASVDGLRRALLQARSVAYSDSASGVYVGGELFRTLGIADAMAGKARMIPGEPVAAVVARGDAELGFQQISELLPVPGIELVGPLPDPVQKITIFSAGVATAAPQPEAGRSLIAYLASPAAAPTIVKTGLEPIAAK